MNFRKVCVIGSGTMGNGIAHVFALKGFEVSLYDLSEEALEKAILNIDKNLTRQVKKESITRDDREIALSNITCHTDLPAACSDADICIEAITESFEAKSSLFSQLSKQTKSDCVLASNTSSISIKKIGVASGRPNKVIGMHFMNPVPLMPLVEVIKSKDTDEHVYTSILELSKSLGKIPILANDSPGFVANRILMPMINESILSLEEGVADVQGIDQVMKLGMAHPMGPLELADYIGLDVCLFIIKELYTGFDNIKYKPSKLLETLVNSKELGIKSGKGFYDYSDRNQKTPRKFS